MHSPLLLFYGPSVLVLLRILYQQTFVSSPVLYKPTLQWLFTIHNPPPFFIILCYQGLDGRPGQRGKSGETGKQVSVNCHFEFKLMNSLLFIIVMSQFLYGVIILQR